MAAEKKKYSLESKVLYQPESTAFCTILNDGLKKNFQHVVVAEVDCPDLTQTPWCLAAKGICGSPKLLDVGGVPNLIPTPRKEKIYRFDELAEMAGNQDAYFLGAGAAGFHILGINAEMMANLRLGKEERIETYVASVNKEGECDLKKFPEKEFGLLGNFLASEGLQGKVIKINAKTRIGEENFIQSIRNVLKEAFPNNMIGLGGVFMIKSGKARLHVMPCFSESPLITDEDVENWLKFYEMSSPLVCLSVFYNYDEGMDLRIDHTHCFSHHGEGGHYHHDTTPSEVEYEGYFVVAEELLRVDRPTQTHLVGRD